MTTTHPLADVPAATEERREKRTGNLPGMFAAGVRDGIGRHRQELIILFATIVFVLVVGWLGKTMVTS